MEYYSSFSYRAVGISIIIHGLLLFFLLFVIIQKDKLMPFWSKPQVDGEPSVVFMPSYAKATAGGPSPSTSALPAQPAQSTPMQMVGQPTIAPPVTQSQQERQAVQEEQESTPEEISPVQEPQPQEQSAPSPTTLWSPERARNRWRKFPDPSTPQPSLPFDARTSQARLVLEDERKRSLSSEQASMQQAIRQSFTQALMQDFGSENYTPQLKQKVKHQFTKEQHEHYQFGIAKMLLYELNKQHIIEVPNNLPSVIIVEIIIDRDGNVHDVQLVQASRSVRFDQQMIAAVRAASPFKQVPASISGERIPLQFSFHYKPTPGGDMNVPAPVNFFMS